MGGAVSHFFQSGSALLTAGNHRGCSDATRARVRTVFDALRANPRVTVQRLEGLLSQIPKVCIFPFLPNERSITTILFNQVLKSNEDCKIHVSNSHC